MSRVRAYLSECLLWAVRKTQLEIPIHTECSLSVQSLHGSGIESEEVFNHGLRCGRARLGF